MKDQADRRTLFIVSARAGDALAASARDAGWRTIIDGGGEDVAARALASRAEVLLVDARRDGVDDVQALGGLAAATGCALIALTDDSAIAAAPSIGDSRIPNTGYSTPSRMIVFVARTRKALPDW